MKNHIQKMSAEIDTSTLNVVVYYNMADADEPKNLYPVAIVPVIDGNADELDWDISKAYYESGAARTEAIADEIMAAIPEIIKKADLAW